MKKFSVKRLLAVVLAITVVLGAIGVTAMAATSEPAVLYDGREDAFVVENAFPFNLVKADMPDLFVNFKEMMPGDNVTQTITVGTRNTGWDTVNLYLRTEATGVDSADEAYRKLLESGWVTLTVSQDGEVLAEGDLSEGVLLGSFQGDQTTELTVQLSIDILAGNELQDLTAGIDWVFTAEIQPSTPIIIIPGNVAWLICDDHYNYIVGYPDGSVRPNGNITRAEATTIFFRLLTEEARTQFWSTSNSYPDVSGDDWFNVAVSTMTKAGVIEGYPDGTFRPNNPITRAELSAIISRFDLDYNGAVNATSFSDIRGHWAEDEIEQAAYRGWVCGYPDGTFRPNQNITRAETVTMINRVLRRAVDEEGLLPNHIQWTDNYTNSWYYYDMQEAGDYHDYEYSGRVVENQPYNYENWLIINDRIDWAAMEQEWIRIYG